MPHISIKFLWISSHIGITHNEKVDSLAKGVIRSGDSLVSTYPKSFKTPKSSYLLIQPQLPRTPWYTHCNDLRRSFIIKLSRLRLGHNRLPQHLFRIRLIDSPYCPLHPKSHTIFTRNHLFFECPSLSQLRQLLYSNLITYQLTTPPQPPTSSVSKTATSSI